MLNHHTTKMELNLNNKKTSSQDLLACGNGGLHDKLLLKSKGPKAGSYLQTERVPISSVMDRLQNFLPQLTQANEKLKLQMEQAPEGHYDIERVEESGKVIEMDVSLVELSSSDSDSDRESSQDNGTNSDSEEESELTEENLKLPGNSQRQIKKVHIQVLEKQLD
ncbi:NOP protein chaperone 1-like [Oncorhynchus clarkii lewisi]|uniref:NOP protein chaperone 1-like n=1 Tax=Oncorhynchus clarkii lewisi TaxID=490388 RepID=UPI0039B90CA5